MDGAVGEEAQGCPVAESLALAAGCSELCGPLLRRHHPGPDPVGRPAARLSRRLSKVRAAIAQARARGTPEASLAKAVTLAESLAAELALPEPEALGQPAEWRLGPRPVRQGKLCGVPSEPLIDELARAVQIWHQTGQCPAHRPRWAWAGVAPMAGHWEMLQRAEPELLALCDQIAARGADRELGARVLELLSARGVMSLLGCQQTAGTMLCGLPSREELCRSFCEPHSQGEPLTAGGRALAKHAARGSWWGEPTGTDTAKNLAAWGRLREMLLDAVWLNVHAMPPYTECCLEIRLESGHGARWTWRRDEGPEWRTSFRGFLDPTGVRLKHALADCEGSTERLRAGLDSEGPT